MTASSHLHPSQNQCVVLNVYSSQGLKGGIESERKEWKKGRREKKGQREGGTEGGTPQIEGSELPNTTPSHVPALPPACVDGWLSVLLYSR